MNENKRTMPLLPLAGLIFLVAVLHYLGFALQLYWRIPWYDRVIHTLGGMWVALTLFSLLSLFNIYIYRVITIFCISLGAAIVVGVAWEIFELKTGITNMADHGYMLDTTGDILSDIFGGLLAYVYTLKYWKLGLWNLQK